MDVKVERKSTNKKNDSLTILMNKFLKENQLSQLYMV